MHVRAKYVTFILTKLLTGVEKVTNETFGDRAALLAMIEGTKIDRSEERRGLPMKERNNEVEEEEARQKTDQRTNETGGLGLFIV